MQHLLVHHPRPTHKGCSHGSPAISVSALKVHGALQVAVRFPHSCTLRALAPFPDPALGSREFLETAGLCFSGVPCPRSEGAPALSSRRGTCRDPVTPALGGPQERHEFHVVWCLLFCPCGGRGAVCILGVSGESPLSSASEEPHKPLPRGAHLALLRGSCPSLALCTDGTARGRRGRRSAQHAVGPGSGGVWDTFSTCRLWNCQGHVLGGEPGGGLGVWDICCFLDAPWPGPSWGHRLFPGASGATWGP